MCSWRMHVERRFAEITELRLPLPGGGATHERWAAFARFAEEDLSLARLSEGHFDALAILAELRGPAPVGGERWGVWAAQPAGLEVVEGGVRGVKPYCSGARACTRALVTAGDRLFAVHPGEPVKGSWPATGMAASDSLSVRFADAPAGEVGPRGGYTERPGFHHGGIGVAAVWYGGARAAEVLDRTGRALGAGPLSHDEEHGRRVADLTVYIRQHHADRDLASLGELVTGEEW